MKYSDNRIRSREMPLKPLREFSSMLAQGNEYAESTGGIRLERITVMKIVVCIIKTSKYCIILYNHNMTPLNLDLNKKLTIKCD